MGTGNTLIPYMEEIASEAQKRIQPSVEAKEKPVAVAGVAT